MKNKSKVILGLSSILAVSAGVAGVSTFAWFTAAHSAQATFSSITVHSKNAALSITASTISGDDSMQADDGHTSTSSHAYLKGKGTMSDVSSGDGKTFYHPNWAAADTEGKTAGSISDIVSNTSTDIYFRQLKLTFTNDGKLASGDKSVNIYITKGCTILPTDSSKDVDKAAAKAMRMAILDPDNSNALLAYWQYGAEGSVATPATAEKPNQYNYVNKTGTATDLAYTVKNYKIDNASSIGKATLGGDFADAEDTATSPTTLAKQLITSTAIPAEGHKDVIVKLWIEGTSDYCTTSQADGGSAEFNLTFSAATVA
jgi:hypothetical protein